MAKTYGPGTAPFETGLMLDLTGFVRADTMLAVVESMCKRWRAQYEREVANGRDYRADATIGYDK